MRFFIHCSVFLSEMTSSVLPARISSYTALNWHFKGLTPSRNFLPPANEVCEGYVFTGVCLSTGCVVAPRGACVVAPGGHAWLLWGGMCGCSGGGVCAWLLLGGRCTWLLWGGMCGYSGRVCMVATGGGMRGCSGGVCVVAPGGGCAWLLLGGCAWLLWGGMCGFFDEIWSMSRRYASYWNAFLFMLQFSRDRPRSRWIICSNRWICRILLLCLSCEQSVKVMEL